MELAECCPNRDPRWRQSKVGDRYADLLVCASCQHIHKMESWLVPLAFPTAGRCVNCGGAQVGAGRDARCQQCGFTAAKDKELHEQLASLHPDHDFLQAAIAAAELGRNVLGLKLASAAIRWGDEDTTIARTVRLQALEAIGALDKALDEAYGWAQEGAPPVVWGIIADLEASAGNIEGAGKALRYGLELDPTNVSMWTDFAELLAALDERGAATQAARHGLADPEYRHRCLQVMAEIADRYHAEGLKMEASDTMAFAGDLQERNVGMAWLHARMAAEIEDSAVAIRWLETVLAIDPTHGDAKAALEKIRPKKRGWLPW